MVLLQKLAFIDCKSRKGKGKERQI